MQRLRIAISIVVLSLISSSAGAADEKPSYTPDDFVTSYWAGPPGKFTTLERYQEVKDANFTVAFPVIYGASVEANKAMLDHCQKLGMKAIIYDGRMVASIEGSADRKKALFFSAVAFRYRNAPNIASIQPANNSAVGRIMPKRKSRCVPK